MKENMQPVAIYHRVMRRENFETAAKDLIGLLAEAQKTQPDRPRKLYLDIDGHRNEAGGFDADMLELQKEFGIGFLLQYFTEVHFPLGTIANQGEQNNDVPDHFEIFHAAENGDDSLNKLYLENYTNTEFMSEKDVFEFLSSVSKFLKKFSEQRDVLSGGVRDPLGLLQGWSQYMRDLMIELFNSFIYGNLLSVSAMTRALIESYVYVRILLEDASGKRLGEWCLCSLLSGKGGFGKKREEKLQDIVAGICQTLELDRRECCARLKKGRQNGWLSEIVGKNRVTFWDACKYLGEPEIYDDFQTASAFVHGQDIVSKCIPFTFYTSIYHKLYIMMHYCFRTVRLYPSAEKFEDEMGRLEEELMNLSENYL